MPVYVGMRNWAPYIADTLARMALDGVRRALGVILAPHATEASCERYMEAVDAGARRSGRARRRSSYVASVARPPALRRGDGRAGDRRPRRAAGGAAADARLVFTAHSIPVADGRALAVRRRDRGVARGVAARLGRPVWEVAYQSRSGSPRDPWLEPDVNDVAASALAPAVRGRWSSAPIGFVCDHVEVLYDLDVEARATAGRCGLAFARAETVNDHPPFVAHAGGRGRGSPRA